MDLRITSDVRLELDSLEDDDIDVLNRGEVVRIMLSKNLELEF